jgi:hypothetical protein
LVEGNPSGGFDYQTGGGGMVFNRKVVEKMLSHDHCKCPSQYHHDDAHLVKLDFAFSVEGSILRNFISAEKFQAIFTFELGQSFIPKLYRPKFTLQF